ncbi:MAG: hypothetical protein ACE366_24360 [Bradymonadia bacterium]
MSEQDQKGFTDEFGRPLQQLPPQTEEEAAEFEQQAMEDQGAQMAWLQYLQGQPQGHEHGMTPEAMAVHRARGGGQSEETLKKALEAKKQKKAEEARTPVSVVERERSVEVEGPEEDDHEHHEGEGGEEGVSP